MRTVVITPPASPLIDVATVRARAQIAATTADVDIQAYIATAIAGLDGPDGIMGRALGVQTLQLQAAHFPTRCERGHPHYENWLFGFGSRAEIFLSYPEIISVTSISYIDLNGARQTLDPSLYILSGRRIVPAYQQYWPLARVQPASVQITYQAGYSGTIPAPILQAIVLKAAVLNGTARPDISLKQDTSIGIRSQQWETSVDVGAAYERAITALLAPYMVWSRDA
jgi:hypothetical protein